MITILRSADMEDGSTLFTIAPLWYGIDPQHVACRHHSVCQRFFGTCPKAENLRGVAAFCLSQATFASFPFLTCNELKRCHASMAEQACRGAGYSGRNILIIAKKNGLP